MIFTLIGKIVYYMIMALLLISNRNNVCWFLRKVSSMMCLGKYLVNTMWYFNALQREVVIYKSS